MNALPWSVQHLLPKFSDVLPIGFGLFLIKRLTDQVEFNQRTDGGHVVRMAIKISRKG